MSLEKLQELEELVKNIYIPKYFPLFVWQDKALGCHLKWFLPANPTLVCSLNIYDSKIYIYLKNSALFSNLLSHFNNFELKISGNTLYCDISSMSKIDIAKKFANILIEADIFYQKNSDLQAFSNQKQIIKGNYFDNIGNRIFAPINLEQCYFKFMGRNNRIIIDPNANLKNIFLEFCGDNAQVNIGSNVKVTGTIRLGYGCEVRIGKNSSSTNPIYATCAEHTKIIIGDDCMFATNNQIRTDDSHAIYDVRTGKRVNKSKDIILGDHVWVAYGATLLGGANIGNGSIVGAFSLVKKAFPNNCIVVGSPARVVRRDIFWERPNVLNFDKEIIYSQEDRENKIYCNITNFNN